MQPDSDTKSKHLFKTISEYKNAPFKWGVSDCCQFVSKYIFRCTEVDLASKYGNYKTKQGAARAIKKHGDIVTTVATVCEEVPVTHLQRGDIVALDAEDEISLGLVTGVGIVTMIENAGLQVTNSKIISGWRI